jgi:hypothetical protein
MGVWWQRKTGERTASRDHRLLPHRTQALGPRLPQSHQVRTSNGQLSVESSTVRQIDSTSLALEARYSPLELFP